MAKRKRNRTGTEVAVRKAPRDLMPPGDGQGWMTIFNSPQPEYAFQRNEYVNPHVLDKNWTVFACKTLIAGDMGKMRIKLVTREKNTWQETQSASFSPVLRKPNDFQTWPKFVQQWMLSKLGNGNAYLLKERDARKVTVKLYVLDPYRVTPLVAQDGSVYYRLYADDLAGIPDNDDVVVPASEIMHDRMWCLFHPLVGLSPLFACALAAMQGLTIQEQSKRFFANSSRPGGILTAPTPITDELALKYKKRWEENYAGGNEGRTAVLGNGLSYSPITQNAVDSDLVAQFNLTSMMICSTYHVPGYKVGVGPTPTYQNAEVLDQIYLSDCLQVHIQDSEELLDDGLGLSAAGYHAQFDLDDLLRMDSATQIKTLNDSVAGGWMKIDEARAKRNLLPVTGGNTPYLQQQNYSLAALDKRDTSADPFAKAPAPALPAPTAANDAQAEDATASKLIQVMGRRFLKEAHV